MAPAEKPPVPDKFFLLSIGYPVFNVCTDIFTLAFQFFNIIKNGIPHQVTIGDLRNTPEHFGIVTAIGHEI